MRFSATFLTVSATGSARIPPTSSPSISRISLSRSVAGRQGRAASCTSIQSSASSTAIAATRPLYTESRRVCAAAVERLAAGRRTRSSRARRTPCPPARGPRTPIRRGARKVLAPSARASAGRRAAGIALARSAGMRVPLPAAGIRAYADTVSVRGSSFNSGRYNYSQRASDAPRFASRPQTLHPACRLRRCAGPRAPGAGGAPSVCADHRHRTRRAAPGGRDRSGSRRSCAYACCRTGKPCPTTSFPRTTTWCRSAWRRFIASSAANSTSRWCRRRPRWCGCVRPRTSPAAPSS